MDPLNLVTGFESGKPPATFRIALDTEPEYSVTVSLQSKPCELKVEGPSSLVFTPDDWSFPQTITLQPVKCTFAAASESNPAISLTTFSEDTKFENMDSSPVLISVTDTEKCPAIALLENVVFVSETHIATNVDPDFNLFLHISCQQYIFWKDTDSAKAAVYPHIDHDSCLA